MKLKFKPVNFKSLLIGSVFGVAVTVALALADRNGLYQAFLQSNLDGNSNSITNLLNAAATNFTILGSTNQVIFGGTNTAPVNPSNIVTWISVQVVGMTNTFRLGLFQ